MEKKIEVVKLKVKDIQNRFGNPRKITKKKREDLERSLETYGDFGLFIIDENNDVIAGNQRLEILKQRDREAEVLCKQLIGYTESEKRAINIKDNVHSGDWDLDLLADWTADLTIDLGIEDVKDIEERRLEKMELIRYEKYDYVILVCDNEMDYNELVRNLGIEGKKVDIAKRKIKARAIWYSDMKAQIVPKK